jgi:N-ethylmaleimide reductase
VAGWQKVTQAVHAAGGRIFLQLWHVGRISHPDYQPGGALPVAPSAIRARGQCFTPTGMKDFVQPRALDAGEIPGVIAEYVAGGGACEGPRVSRGWKSTTPTATCSTSSSATARIIARDRYGGSVRNRARLSLEVVEAVASVWGAERVGIRLSPAGVFNDMSDTNPMETFGHVLRELSHFGLAYAHVTQVTAQDIAHGRREEGVGPRELRGCFRGPMVTAGGFDLDTGNRALAEGWADAIAYGVPFLANPDLPERFRRRAPLNLPDEATFYAPGPKGYTDYPALAGQAQGVVY